MLITVNALRPCSCLLPSQGLIFGRSSSKRTSGALGPPVGCGRWWTRQNFATWKNRTLIKTSEKTWWTRWSPWSAGWVCPHGARPVTARYPPDLGPPALVRLPFSLLIHPSAPLTRWPSDPWSIRSVLMFQSLKSLVVLIVFSCYTITSNTM